MRWINGCIYPCKPIGKYPQCYAERVMHGKYKGIKISWFEVKGEKGFTVNMTNRYARLLKDRITRCLEDTP